MKRYLFSLVFLVLSSPVLSEVKFLVEDNAGSNPIKKNSYLLPEIASWLPENTLRTEPQHNKERALSAAFDSNKEALDIGEILKKASQNPLGLESFSLKFNLFLFPDFEKIFKLTGVLSRISSRQQANPEATKDLWRERIEITSPTALADYRWLSFRLKPEEEDGFWIHSGQINKTRQLTATNRSDPIFKGAISPNDFFLWSDKASQLEVESYKVEKYLVARRKKQFQLGSCDNPESLDNSLKYGFQVPGKLTQQERLIPEEVEWSLRDVVIVEARQRDPFAFFVRETLVIDLVSGLAVARVLKGRQQEVLQSGFSVIAEALPNRAGFVTDTVIKTTTGYLVLAAKNLNICKDPLHGQSFEPASF